MTLFFFNFALTGYIPKAWICKTLNLHLNRSVLSLSSYVFINTNNMFNQIFFTQCGLIS